MVFQCAGQSSDPSGKGMKQKGMGELQYKFGVSPSSGFYDESTVMRRWNFRPRQCLAVTCSALPKPSKSHLVNSNTIITLSEAAAHAGLDEYGTKISYHSVQVQYSFGNLCPQYGYSGAIYQLFSNRVFSYKYVQKTARLKKSMTTPQLEAGDLVTQIVRLFWIPAKQRSLLIYYIQHASQESTCSIAAQRRSNELIIPMALQNPSLLKSLLAWSAGHKCLHSDLPQDKTRWEITYSELVQSSLQSLQMEIRDAQRTNKVALIAASLMLCLQKLYMESLESKSWRVHLDGAKVIISAANQSNYEDPDDVELLRMLSRWYEAIEALTALTAREHAAGQAPFTQASSLVGMSVAEGQYLDEFCGYAFELNDILRRIGAAAWERRTKFHAASQYVEFSSEDFEKEADWLESSVLSMMAECQSSGPLFYPGVAEQLSTYEIQDFVLCNKAYQNMALIHIQRRVRRLPSASTTVQGSVQNILECGSSMTRTGQSSPWIAMAPPFFTAGCDAFGVDRHTVRDLLQALYCSTHSATIRRALSILESYWTDDQGFDYYDWEMLPGNRDMDFIPY